VLRKKSLALCDPRRNVVAAAKRDDVDGVQWTRRGRLCGGVQRQHERHDDSENDSHKRSSGRKVFRILPAVI